MKHRQTQHRRPGVAVQVGIAVCLLQMRMGYAQLTDLTQTTPHVPGSSIGKSLEEQIGAGQGDEWTPGASIYLIKRDPARSIRRGRQLFQRKFTTAQGLGPRVDADAFGNIHDAPALGAGLTDSCAACHGRPRGAAGFGGDVATRPDSRDAPHLFGLGLIEILADEITTDLRAVRDQAKRDAVAQGAPATQPLRSKTITYGSITAHPDGSVDTSAVEGVDPDLRVRPFFAQGATVSIREFIIGAFKAEMGLEVADPILCAATHPANPQRAVSPAGFVYDPTQDVFERPPLCDPGADGDSDGVVNEIDAALLDHMEFYLLNYFKPGQYKITSGVREGLKTFEEIACTKCHVQDLSIAHDRRIADVETQFDPIQGLYNRLYATATPLFDVLDDGEPYPQMLPRGKLFMIRNLFTDLKRHDLGPYFHERNYDGSLQTVFVTEPLWGVGTSAPYGHDGRSINLEEVILRHGGEAQASRDRFEALSEPARGHVLDFLRSLVLFPPDDTASNLNPAVADGDPQTDHGSIHLGALFQIDTEGPE